MWKAKRESALALVALGGLGLSGCKQAAQPIQPSIFTNPNEVSLVCFDGATDQELEDYAKSHAGFDPTTWDPTLPLECCNGVIGTDDEVAQKLERCRALADVEANPVSHALVTQVQRGEVAAVDLVAKKVLDSDKRIPGYTFVDVGGLPTAIAVRPGGEGEQPRWTYVAGRERNSLRAVATCRFKTGKICGPELAVSLEDSERALAGEPFDMLLAADGQGLWVTLPDAGLLAYVPLPEAADEDLPFAGEIVYYPLPGGFDAKPSLPEPEPAPYRFACRFDESKATDAGVTEVEGDESDGGMDEPAVEPDMSDPAPWEAEKQVMPLSVPAESTRVARPTLLRTLDLNPRGESDPTRKLLFVADEGQMALHAYTRDAAGNLALVASVPVGAPLRDFAITPEVPVAAPSYARLVTESYYEEPRATTRYLYGVDQRDGSLMAFSLAFEAGVPKLVPLLAPTPFRDASRQALNRADRFALGPDPLQARALDVVDTRMHRRADGSYDDAHCHVDDRAKDLQRLETRSEVAKAAYDDDPSPENERDMLLAAEDLSVPTSAGAPSLRGVFLMVATTNGGLAVLDIHDLDLECRADLQCTKKPELETGVVIARHTPRMSGTEVPTISISGADEVAIARSCPDGYELRADRDERNRVCVSKDAWLSRSFNFTVAYEGAFTGAIADAVLEDAGDGRLLLKAPQGVDLCARGANVEDGVLVGIVSTPDDEKRSGGGCEVTSFSTLPRLRVLEARRDELLLEPLPDDADAETLLACYRHLVTFDLRLDKQYVVRSEALPYQHRNMSAADGTCIRDEALDSRYTSRASLDEPFLNQFVSFTLSAKGVTVDAGAPSSDAGRADAGGVDAGAEEDGGADEDAGADDEDEGEGELDALELARRREVNPSITISVPSVRSIAAAVGGAASNRSDVLPHRVRYFPDNNYLFVVDQASQGLRRFFLQPTFGADTESLFR